MALIRTAKISDARGLAVVSVVVRQVGFEGMVDAEFLASLSVDADEELWRNVIATRGDQIRVAPVEDRVVGFAMFGPYRTSTGDVEPKAVGELYGFSVHPDSWGTGVSNELHDAAVDELRARNLAPLKLWVFEANGTAGLRTAWRARQRWPVGQVRLLRAGCRPLKVQPSIDSCSGEATRGGRRGCS